jgi:hypothetical protein
MTFFTQEKGTLLPEKGKLAKLGGGLYTPLHYTVTQLNHAHKCASKHVFSLSLSNKELYARDKLSAIIENCNGKTWSVDSKNDCQTISSTTPESCVKAS